MKVITTKQFIKDVEKELNKSLQIELGDIIEELHRINRLEEIKNLKKLKGFKTAYRIRLRDFRIGFIYENDEIILSRVMNRKEVYRFFP